MLEAIIKSRPPTITSKSALECVVQNSVSFSVKDFAPFAAFPVPFAVEAALPAVFFPAFAAIYSFLIACFCFHLERKLEFTSG